MLLLLLDDPMIDPRREVLRTRDWGSGHLNSPSLETPSDATCNMPWEIRRAFYISWI